MRFDIHMRKSMRDRLADVTTRMAAWDQRQPPSQELHQRLVDAIEPFDHTVSAPGLVVGGVDGSGDFPAIAYADSFVYATVASATLYQADSVHGLKEVEKDLQPLIEFTWLTTSEQQRATSLLDTFERLAGLPVDEILAGSDYSLLGHQRRRSISEQRSGLIVPPAHDAGNVGIQLRTTAELGAALRLVEIVPEGAIVLTDGTMSLPFVNRDKQSLFFEYLRRFCCVRARSRAVRFAALSKSHGLPSGVRLEEAAQAKCGSAEPEHWFLKLPDSDRDGWSLWPPDGPRVPPLGAVSFLVRLHRTSPIMRLDLDERFWDDQMEAGRNLQAVRQFFGLLDYASHDQRCFGYPYPIKAAHDRGSLTEQERTVLRQQLVESAVHAGMRRASFRDPSQLTGHR